MAGDPDQPNDEGREWRFSLDEVGPESESSTIEAGRPALENVVFFVLGVATALLALLSLIP